MKSRLLLGCFLLCPLPSLSVGEGLYDKLRELTRSGFQVSGEAEIAYRREQWSETFQVAYSATHCADYILVELESRQGDRLVVFNDRTMETTDYYVRGRPMIEDAQMKSLHSTIPTLLPIGPYFFFDSAEAGHAMGNFDRFENGTTEIVWELKPEKVDHSLNNLIRPSQTRTLKLDQNGMLTAHHYVHFPDGESLLGSTSSAPHHFIEDGAGDQGFSSEGFGADSSPVRTTRGTVATTMKTIPTLEEVLSRILPRKIKGLTRMSYSSVHPAKVYNPKNHRGYGTPAEQVLSAIERQSGKQLRPAKPGGESGRRVRNALLAIGTLLVLSPLLLKMLRRSKSRV